MMNLTYFNEEFIFFITRFNMDKDFEMFLFNYLCTLLT